MKKNTIPFSGYISR